MRAIVPVLLLLASATHAQTPVPPPLGESGASTYSVFIGSRIVGREEVVVVRQADGWVVRGTSRIGPPVDIVTRQAEVRYNAEWQPQTLMLEGTVRGTETSIKTTFSAGRASNTITVADDSSTKDDEVAADALVLPNAFLGSYAALARRLVGSEAGATFQGYIAPQGAVPIQVQGVFPEKIETAQRAINASRYALQLTNPGGALQVSLWAGSDGALLRLSVPAQMLELSREDVASASARTTSFSLAADESVRIPASGFTLAASVTKPQGGSRRLPALVLVGGSGPMDRDGYVAGIPLLGQLARGLVEGGFLVVRYDKRGVGQSGGRSETATLTDYAEDLRAVVRWTEDRDDIDADRVAVVGHSEGAWIAMLAASRDRRIKALALLAAPAISGSELVLEQQRHVLARLNTPDADAQTKIALQKRINAAASGGGDWTDISPEVRSAADTPWFQSFLAFDPAKVMKDVRQPALVLQGELDTQVPSYHADRLIELAQARKRNVASDVAVVPGINHLLVPATTGEVDEYATLGGKEVSPAVSSAVGSWMARQLGDGSR